MEKIDIEKVIGGKNIKSGISDKACQVADWF